MVVDGGPAARPSGWRRRGCKSEADDEREEDQQEREVVEDAPERQLRHVEPGVVSQHRLADAVAQPLATRARRRASSADTSTPGQEAEEQPADHRDGEQQRPA